MIGSGIFRRLGGLAAGAVFGLACSAGATAAAPAVDYVDLWGPAVGSELPLLDAADQRGERRTLGDLTGRRGLLLFLVRSADW